MANWLIHLQTPRESAHPSPLLPITPHSSSSPPLLWPAAHSFARVSYITFRSSHSLFVINSHSFSFSGFCSRSRSCHYPPPPLPLIFLFPSLSLLSPCLPPAPHFLFIYISSSLHPQWPRWGRPVKGKGRRGERQDSPLLPKKERIRYYGREGSEGWTKAGKKDKGKIEGKITQREYGGEGKQEIHGGSKL